MTDKTLTTAPIEGELVAQFCTHGDIEQLRDKYASMVIIDDDKDSYKAVKAALTDVKATRVGIEKSRKALKAKALDYGRAVDAHAKDLTAAIKPLEDALAQQKAVVDAAKAKAKAEAERAEAERVIEIRERISAITKAPQAVMGGTSSQINAAIETLRTTEIDDSYGEFGEHAVAERTHAIATLVRLFDHALEAETIAAENERLRAQAEQAEKDREAAERARKTEQANAAARETLYKIQAGDAAYGGFMGPIFKEWMQEGTVESYTSDEALLHDLQAAGYKAEQEQAERDRKAAEAAKHQPKLTMVTSGGAHSAMGVGVSAQTMAQLEDQLAPTDIAADRELAADRDADVADLQTLREQLLHLEIPLGLRTEAAQAALTFILEARLEAIALIDQLTPLKETQSHVK